MSTATKSPTNPAKVITGKVRFSYVSVWEKTAIGDSDEEKYSISLIIPKSDKAQISKIEKAIEAAKQAGKSKWGGKIPAKLKTPLRDGDEDRPDDPAYQDSVFLNATCKTKPGVVDANVDPIIDQDEFYSGCYGRASITFYAFDVNGNRGIACGLNHVQKLADGDHLGGRSSAESDFADSFGDDDLI